MFSSSDLELDVKAEAGRIAQSIRAHVQTLRKRGAIVGLSGGVDSSVVAALCVSALGRDKVLGLFMPERDSSADALRLGRMLAAALGIDSIVEDIAPALDAAGCYVRQQEAIRTLVPEFGHGWKFKLALPALLEPLRAWLGSSLFAERVRGAASSRAEVPILVGVDGTVLRGSIDLLVEQPGSPPLIVDYKTDAAAGADLGSLAERYEIQQAIYALAVAEARDATEVELAYVFLERPEEPVLTAWGQAEIEAARHQIKEEIARV